MPHIGIKKTTRWELANRFRLMSVAFRRDDPRPTTRFYIGGHESIGCEDEVFFFFGLAALHSHNTLQGV